jgi:DNA primase
MPNFDRGGDRIQQGFAVRSSFAEVALLDDATKERLCLDLLAEIGAQHVQRPRPDGEIVHSCPLPFGQHRNGDSNPSAGLNYKKLTFSCFSCGASGGFVWFVASCRGEETAETWQWLSGQTGIGGGRIEHDKLIQILESMFAPQTRHVQPLTRYPLGMLDAWAMPEPHPYLMRRGIPEGNARALRIGYAPEYDMGFAVDDDGRRVRRPPQPRITIPVFWENQLVGWQARAIRTGDEPKYKNSVDFPRDRVLYGWSGRGRDVVLVEGIMSVLRHHHHQPMVASFGAKVTDDQLRTLQGAASIVVWFDPDNGGWRGTEHVISALERYVPLRVVTWPYRDVDPADLDDATVDRCVAEAVPWALWRRPETMLEWKG